LNLIKDRIEIWDRSNFRVMKYVERLTACRNYRMRSLNLLFKAFSCNWSSSNYDDRACRSYFNHASGVFDYRMSKSLGNKWEKFSMYYIIYLKCIF